MAENQSSQVSRRRFLGFLIGGISGVIAAGVAAPVIGYFLSPGFRKNTPLVTPIGNTSDIPVGVPTKVDYEQRVRQGWYITTLSKVAWVLTFDGKNFVVYDPKCTHLNCPYHWDADKKEFLCPCHGGRFDINGNVLGGPPPRPLDKLQVQVQNGQILILG